MHGCFLTIFAHLLFAAPTLRLHTYDAAILALFYIVLAFSGVGLEGARETKWVGGKSKKHRHQRNVGERDGQRSKLMLTGELFIVCIHIHSRPFSEVAPPVPVSDLFTLVDYSLVRWDLIRAILPTWMGMVFVVSFGSCLDITAISVDMGSSSPSSLMEPLDTNRELAVIGCGNMLSGLCLGFTGSYIFSQSIFTYRTGVHSRWMGAIIVLVFAYLCSLSRQSAPSDSVVLFGFDAHLYRVGACFGSFMWRGDFHSLLVSHLSLDSYNELHWYADLISSMNGSTKFE